MSDPAAVVAAVEAAVREEMGKHDSSHDFFHVERVQKTAVRLAKEEGADEFICSLGALLHDVRDEKYSGSSTASGEFAEELLPRLGVAPEVVRRVVDVINGVSFKSELKRAEAAGAAGAGAGLLTALPLEVACVQDADRLDAIGAIGIARCLTFGGARNRVLHDPSIAPSSSLSHEAYAKSSTDGTSINHFYDKLLHLKDLMKTEAGRRTAAQRHDFMVSYLDQFHAEWQGGR